MISVIVPALNAADTLGTCLSALLAQSLPRTQYEVIVVDDGSTDGTAEIAHRSGVRVICQQHAGPAAARNLGARVAQGELLLFTDADCEPAPDWIAHMSGAFQDPELQGAKGAYRTRQKHLVARFVQLEYEDKYRRLRRQRRVDFVDTYSAAYRRDVFVANGGFDLAFPTASVEDQEFSFRLARKGYKLAFVPAAIVCHRHDATLGEYWRRKFGIGYWKALLLRRHPERVTGDSHTPHSLKAQVALVGLMMPMFVLAAWWPSLRWPMLAVVLAFVFTTIPFLLHAAQHGWVMLLVSLFLLLVRALALGCGLLVGATHFARLPDAHPAAIGGWERALKRVMDICGSLVGLGVTAPLLALAAVAIRLDSPGPVLLTQQRAGANGRPISVLRLRTTLENAEQRGPGPARMPSPEPTGKWREAPRMTGVGRFLRRTSIDALPQLWNVLRGQMSLVGPQPGEPQTVRLYNDRQRQILVIKPGITGPTWVSGRADLDLDDRVRLELDYVEHYSLWKDIRILARTVWAVVSGRGAH